MNGPDLFLEKHLPEGGFLFLDEVQRVEGIGEILKILFDEREDIRVVASGSSSLRLREDVAPFLVGRALFFTLHSFSFQEFLRYKDDGLARIHERNRETFRSILKGEEVEIKDVYRESFQRYLKEYLSYGGYPRIVLEEDEEKKQKLLSSLIELYIERDFSRNVGSVSRFLTTLKYIAGIEGGLVHISSLSTDLGLSKKEAERYIELLERTYILKRVRPFHTNVPSELRKSPKIYFYDRGIRNGLLGMHDGVVRGEDLEAFVFGELTRMGYEAKFWRTKHGAEVDFVVKEGDQLIPIEVKLGSRSLRSLFSFMRKYGTKRAVVVTFQAPGVREIDEGMIYFLPPWFL